MKKTNKLFQNLSLSTSSTDGEPRFFINIKNRFILFLIFFDEKLTENIRRPMIMYNTYYFSAIETILLFHTYTELSLLKFTSRLLLVIATTDNKYDTKNSKLTVLLQINHFG